MTILKNDWEPILKEEFQKDYYIRLHALLKEEYSSYIVYPEMHDIFNALHYTDYQHTKVVILGQDPYHGPNQAQGLSFSVKPEVRIPPSLKNIYKELHDDLGIPTPNHGSLINWAKQGVLLLNTVLTVRKGEPNSHKGKGWELFTNEVIKQVSAKTDPVVFILWGRHAQEKAELITASHHLIIKSPHPSPFSARRGFFGSRPFSRTNQFLEEEGRTPIDWRIE
ncbi:uracil-DNA glycosylase [Oceanobacillus chungangensis]|uniref:Uracil-DNA glycosylase n=1 Tax=Oceanobacillus chungangensis TaxID=1229152 RepID=A0A3D8PIE6_9BACI|nr:uracil-DNA glycosylase [Oceanobacillus chungangensis]RDW15011.1 uracil-DNA glycosylase [Oceanobacillus chungangensis]